VSSTVDRSLYRHTPCNIGTPPVTQQKFPSRIQTKPIETTGYSWYKYPLVVREHLPKLGEYRCE